MTKLLLLIIGTLIYILWPFDVVPDFLGVVGWLDDLLVAGLAVYTAVKMFQRAIRKGPPSSGKRKGVAGKDAKKDIIDTTAERDTESD